MAVETDCAAGVEIVEQHVFFGQGVMVGRDVAPIHDEFRVAVALRQIAKNLVVSAVFFDYEKDMLDSERSEIGDAAGGFELGTVGGNYLACAAGDLGGERRRD